MEINNNLQNLFGVEDQLDMYKVKPQPAKAEEYTQVPLPLDEYLFDTADSNAFDALKQQVKEAGEPGRADYLKMLQQKIAAGEYDVSTDALADAMLADGFMEALI